MIGRRLGRFLVTGKLGQGGMATVWRAQDGLLGREVALKVLAETLASSPDARRRFLHEARTASLLDHPGIVTVYDTGAVEEAVRIACAVAGALSHAHARGVVHRDVTPRNIMVSRDGRVMVLDFGLALVEGQSRVTTSNTTMGTISYLSPEVATGRTADPRSDLYGLGVVLYEALTGALPFPGDRPEAVLYGIVNQPPVPPRAHRPEISEALERIVLRAMARRPEDRPGSAAELVTELQQATSAEAATRPGTEAIVRAAPVALAELPPRGRAPGGPRYLAVLPFEDLGAGEDRAGVRQAFAEGLAEAVAAGLAHLSGLRVVPPALPGPTAAESPQALARRLGANLLLRGSVRRSGSQLRLAWSLIDPRAGLQLAGETVDGSVLELFDLEDRLVASLREALGHEDARAAAPPRLRPHDPAAHERYLQALGYLRRYDSEAAVDGAIALLERLLTSEDGIARIHAALGRAYLYKHRLTSQRAWADRAASACEHALALDADDPDVLVTRGDLRASAGHPAEASADYRRALELRPDLVEALLGLSRACLDAGDLPEAEHAARRAIALHRRDWRGFSMLGFVYFEQGQYARAVEPWRRAVRLSPDNARALRNLGSAYFQLDRHVEAVDFYRRSLELQRNSTAYSNLGTALFWLRRFEEAVEALKLAVDFVPADPVKWGNLGNALYFIPERRAESVAPLEQAVVLMRERLLRNPEDADGWERLGSWLANLDRPAEALEATERALELAPRNPRVLVEAAATFIQCGERSRTLSCLKEAVQHGYGVSLLQRSLALTPLHDDPEFQRILEGAGRPSPEASSRAPQEEQAHDP